MSIIVHDNISNYSIDKRELCVKLNELYPSAIADQQVVKDLQMSEPASYSACLNEYILKNCDRSYELILADFSKSCLAAGKVHKAFAYLTDAIRQKAKSRFVPGMPDTMKENFEASEILGGLGVTKLREIFWTCYTHYKLKSKL